MKTGDEDAVVYGGKVYRKPSPVLNELLFYGVVLLVLVIVGQLFGVAGALIVLVAVFASKLLRRVEAKREDRESADFESACTRLKVQPRGDYSDRSRGFFAALAEGELRLLLQTRGTPKGTWQQHEIDIKKILAVELCVNDRSVYQAGPAATLAGAAAGALTFGGFGAVVGALSAARLGAGDLHSVRLKVRLNSIEQPQIEVPFVLKPIKASSDEANARLALAEKWTNLIQILRHRAGASATANP